MEVILASASPRRSTLLGQIGVQHRTAPADLDETRLPGESPPQYVQRLASAKARHIALASDAAAVVIGADTAVVVDDELFGKPRDRDHALAMLARLSGRSHRVLSAVAVLARGRLTTVVSDSEVFFRVLGSLECAAYWDSGEPRDKAGAYAIQGLGAVFVAKLTGSYSGVMGLPLFETAQLLTAVGVTMASLPGPEPS
jgi:septum formation protein